MNSVRIMRTKRRQYRNLTYLVVVMMFTLSILGAVYTQPANAYTLHGHRWSGTSTTYSIDSSFANRGANWGSTASQAAIDWTNVSISPFVFNPDGNSANRISSGSTDCTKGQLAVTNWTWSTSTGNYIQAPIVVSNNCGYGFWDGTGTLPSNWYDLKSVMRHEFGHVQGLCHSLTSGLLMYKSLAAGQTYAIGSDAQNGSAKIYSSTYTGPGPEAGCTLS